MPSTESYSKIFVASVVTFILCILIAAGLVSIILFNKSSIIDDNCVINEKQNTIMIKLLSNAETLGIEQLKKDPNPDFGIDDIKAFYEPSIKELEEPPC